MAEFLNDWSAGFADRMPDCLRSATFYPEPGAAAYVARRLADGRRDLQGARAGRGLRRARPAARRGVGRARGRRHPVVLHAGSGPVGTAYTGPGAGRRPAALLPAAGAGDRPPRRAGVRRVPGARGDLRAGPPRHDDGLHAVLRRASARRSRPTLLPRLRDLQPKVLLGSDFPNIPYPYAEQLEGLARLDLGDDWLRAVCWDNARRRCSGTRPGNRESSPRRSTPVDWSSVVGRAVSRPRRHTTQQGADRFRLGTSVPGEAGREADVIS